MHVSSMGGGWAVAVHEREWRFRTSSTLFSLSVCRACCQPRGSSQGGVWFLDCASSTTRERPQAHCAPDNLGLFAAVYQIPFVFQSEMGLRLGAYASLKVIISYC